MRRYIWEGNKVKNGGIMKGKLRIPINFNPKTFFQRQRKTVFSTRISCFFNEQPVTVDSTS